MSSNCRLILASNSPRRQQLLRDSGFQFETFTLEIDESYPGEIGVNQIAKYLAEKKNRVYRNHFEDEVVITADTTVVSTGQLMEKPTDASDARQMIKSLSGQSHSVITGVAISDRIRHFSFDDETVVIFKTFSENEIAFYVENFKPFDKAGAYGIQEWIGLIGVERIEGSYFNVMGLPTHSIYQALTARFDIWPE